MTLVSKIGFVLCFAVAAGCVAEEAPTNESEVEQLLEEKTMTWKPINPTSWLPKDTLCKNLEGSIVIPDLSPNCTARLVVSNCHWNTTTSECDCTTSVERTGSGC